MYTFPKLIYAYDPLCCWCYGFSPVFDKLRECFKDRLSIEVICGGLAIGDNAQTINEGYSFIKKSMNQIEQVTGVEFGKNFRMLVKEGSYFFNSEPACIAQTAVKELAPELAADFASAMQVALFRDGQNLNEEKTFTELAEQFSLDIPNFTAFCRSSDIKEKTHSEFEWCKKAGVAGFPALLLTLGDEIGSLSKGYRPYESLESHLRHLLNNIERISSGS